MAEVRGVRGELIDRLVRAIDSPHSDEWREFGIWLVFAIGGQELLSVIPDRGVEPTPGTIGAMITASNTVVGREEYLRLIHRRMIDLVDSGVREDFLVRGAREELTAVLQLLGRTEEADTRRDDMRQDLERLASSPEELARFRAEMAKTFPDVDSDEDLAKRLRELAASPSLQPISREQTDAAWDRLARWRERAELISDQVLDEWQRRWRMSGALKAFGGSG